MKDEATRDWVEQKRLAQAYRIYAETALYDPHFSYAERKARSDYFKSEAERLEGMR